MDTIVNAVENALNISGRPKGSSTGNPPKEGERKYFVCGNWKCNGTT